MWDLMKWRDVMWWYYRFSWFKRLMDWSYLRTYGFTWEDVDKELKRIKGNRE